MPIDNLYLLAYFLFINLNVYMIIEGIDGVTHINIYSKGQTDLGKWLSNFSRTPFICDEGKFESIEGYWYWLGSRDDRLRKLSGYQAKKLGSNLPRMIEVDNFETRIKKAIICKLKAHPYIFKALVDSELPFAHYYVFGGHRKDAGFPWLVEFFEELRMKSKEYKGKSK